LEQFESIREYFRPIQPSIRAGEKNIVYKEIEPKAQLKNKIHCYWQLSTTKLLTRPFNYRVASDGCIDVFFNLRNTNESFVMGFCNKYTEFPIGKEFDYAGIRFYPSIFPLIFGISAKTLSNEARSLESVLPELAEFISTEIKEDFTASIPKLDKYFCTLIQQNYASIDDRFLTAFLEILKRKGHLKTGNVAAGLSPRQLRRLFNYYIGTSPKSFCQVVRFQYILNANPSAQSLKEHKIFFDVGFFDQAHFIKNFTKFYGVTPSKAFT